MTGQPQSTQQPHFTCHVRKSSHGPVLLLHTPRLALGYVYNLVEIVCMTAEMTVNLAIYNALKKRKTSPTRIYDSTCLLCFGRNRSPFSH